MHVCHCLNDMLKRWGQTEFLKNLIIQVLRYYRITGLVTFQIHDELQTTSNGTAASKVLIVHVLIYNLMFNFQFDGIFPFLTSCLFTCLTNAWSKKLQTWASIQYLFMGPKMSGSAPENNINIKSFTWPSPFLQSLSVGSQGRFFVLNGDGLVRRGSQKQQKHQTTLNPRNSPSRQTALCL